MKQGKTWKVDYSRYDAAFYAYLTHYRKGKKVNKVILTKCFKKLTSQLHKVINTFSVTEIPEVEKTNVVEQIMAQAMYR